MLFPTIEDYIQKAIQNFESIPEERKNVLIKIAAFVEGQIRSGNKAELIYVCTHNSRRSHFGQIWGQTAARFYGFGDVFAYSGGTEATAFNPNAIKAVENAGFKIEKDDRANNPLYKVWYSERENPILCFSKIYNHPANPEKNFAAIMTCTDADENCPLVPGTSLRVSIPYEDPKLYDNTDLQEVKYSERCFQIATECLYVFSKVNK